MIVTVSGRLTLRMRAMVGTFRLESMSESLNVGLRISFHPREGEMR